MAKVVSLADRIRAQMNELNIKTIAELERKANDFAERDGEKFPVDTLRNIMAGRSKHPRSGRIVYLAQALRMDIDELVGSKADTLGSERISGPSLRIPLKSLQPYFRRVNSDARVYVQPDGELLPDIAEDEICFIDNGETKLKSNSYFLIEFNKDVQAVRRIHIDVDGKAYYSSSTMDMEALPKKAVVIGRVCAVLRSMETLNG